MNPRLYAFAALSCVAWAFAAPAQPGRQVDLREEYGTRSLEAAEHLSRGIQLKQAKRPEEGLREIELAIKVDAGFQMAHYWRMLALFDLGDIDEGVKAGTQAVSLGSQETAVITMNAAVDMGIQLGMLKRYDEANRWFSRAAVESTAERFAEMRAKAYRNMAITLLNQKRHLSAALAAALAKELSPRMIPDDLIRTCLSKVADDEDVARMLFLDPAPPRPEKRAAGADKLAPVELPGAAVGERIAQLLPDPRGRFVIAIPEQGRRYYVLTTAGEPRSAAVELDRPVAAACYAGESLYVVAGNPARLLQLDPETGKELASHALGGRGATSLAVLPSRGLAYFSSGDTICQLNLKTGAVAATEHAGQKIAATPDEAYVFARVKNDRNGGGFRQVIINGRPVVIQEFGADVIAGSQTTLYKFRVCDDQLVFAEMRWKASSNGYDVVVSPDGKWVSVPGGGGWRPSGGARGGYVVPVFAAGDLSHVQAVFTTDAYPMGCAFNPVTGQVAAVREKEVVVGDLADGRTRTKLQGTFSAACAWSGNGRYLVIAGAKAGVTVYDNPLTESETKLAGTWWEGVARPRPAAAAGGVAKGAEVRGVDSLKTFAPSADPAEVRAALAAAKSGGRTDKPLPWTSLADYAADRSAAAALDEAVADAAGANGVGARIYQANQARRQRPASLPLKLRLAESLRDGGQLDKASGAFLEVVRGDAGRTELSPAALRGLAACLADKDRPVEAVSCLAAALSLDRASPVTGEQIEPLLNKLGWARAAQAVRPAPVTGRPAMPPSPAAAGNLPPLPNGQAAADALNATQVYERAIGGIVMVQTPRGIGTGVCVADGIVVTSLHVVEGARAITVVPYTLRDAKAQRKTPIAASLVAKNEREDIAVLRLPAMNPATRQVKPVPVAAHSPRNGDRVYAIGNPEIDRLVLELTISEGIVSSNDRAVDGVKFLQHTAAVNPGNSGGPLLNDRGEVVGLVSLKASLQNVSFANPCESLRAMFPAKE